MPGNDNVVWGLPNIQCPTCRFAMETGTPFQKRSKKQRKATENTAAEGSYTTASSGRREQWSEDSPSEFPDNTFIAVTCPNERCEQYNKFKILRVPRIETPSAKVEL
jgi:hypothetical protein